MSCRKWQNSTRPSFIFSSASVRPAQEKGLAARGAGGAGGAGPPASRLRPPAGLGGASRGTGARGFHWERSPAWSGQRVAAGGPVGTKRTTLVTKRDAPLGPALPSACRVSPSCRDLDSQKPQRRDTGERRGAAGRAHGCHHAQPLSPPHTTSAACSRAFELGVWSAGHKRRDMGSKPILTLAFLYFSFFTRQAVSLLGIGTQTAQSKDRTPRTGHPPLTPARTGQDERRRRRCFRPG